MAVSDILFALNGFFVPTGVYSFEFRTGGGRKITEVYFMLPPKSVDWDEGQRSTLQPTLKGGYLSDYGNDFKIGTVGGECHFYYVGNPKSPASALGHSGVTGSDRKPYAFIEGLLDGYTEYRKLLFMCMRYRDYTMTKNGKLIAPDFTGQALAPVNALKTHVKQMLSKGKGALADQIVTIWHDYDRDDHFLVKVGSFRSSQSDADPWTIKYTINLEAYAIDSLAPNNKKLSGMGGQIKATVDKKGDFREVIDRWNKIMASEHLESRPDEYEVESVSGATITVPNYSQRADKNAFVDVSELVPSI